MNVSGNSIYVYHLLDSCCSKGVTFAVTTGKASIYHAQPGLNAGDKYPVTSTKQLFTYLAQTVATKQTQHLKRSLEVSFLLPLLKIKSYMLHPKA